jgi:hypothetical protein
VIAVRICILSLTVALVLGAAPAVVAAKPGCGAGAAVPVDSEIDQYAQSIPGACGNQQNDAGGGGSAGGGGDSGDPGSAAGSSIPASTGQRLQEIGANGAGAQALAEANAPRIRSDGIRNDGDRGGGARGNGSADSGTGSGSLLDPLLGSDDDDGMGFVLPLILVAIAAAGAVFVARRRMGRAG